MAKELREGVLVTAWEAAAYDELVAASNAGRVCPTNFELGCLVGASAWENVGSTLVTRLVAKGLITREYWQRFREVTITATGKTTARSPHQHVERPHVPRGMRSSQCVTDRKLYRKGRL